MTTIPCIVCGREHPGKEWVCAECDLERHSTCLICGEALDPPGVVCDGCRNACPHLSTHDAASYPTDRTGRVAVYAVCDDCGQELGQTGWDSVI